MFIILPFNGLNFCTIDSDAYRANPGNVDFGIKVIEALEKLPGSTKRVLKKIFALFGNGDDFVAETVLIGLITDATDDTMDKCNASLIHTHIEIATI